MMIRFDIPSRIQTLEETDSLVYRLAKAVGLDEDSRDDILTAVHKALVNSIVHGNKEEEARHVTLRLALQPDRLPHDLEDLLEQIRAGTLSVHLEHRRLDPVVNRLVRGLVASSLFLGSSLLWRMKAPPLIKGVSLFGVIGYVLALLIGLKLFRTVRRSENLRSNGR